MKRKQGISLIVLVITIIVMIILAAAVVITLSNTGIIERANSATNQMNTKQIQSLATLAWADAFMEGARTEEELQTAVNEALKDTLKDIDESIYEINVTNKGVTVINRLEEPIVWETHSKTIPDGATYYVNVTDTKTEDYSSATAVYTAGQPFPAETNNDDIYVYGDYEYKYNCYYYGYDNAWYENRPLDGWSVRVLDKTKETYGVPLSSINNKEVHGMGYAYYNCINLKKAPAIPDTITTMGGTYTDCISLTTVAKLPNKIKNVNKLFENCTSIKIVPVIPASVEKMSKTFLNCTSLTGNITINANPTSYGSCFSGVDFTAQNIILIGESTMLDTLGETGLNYCAECNGKCKGTH